MGVIGYCAVDLTIAPDGTVSDAKVTAAYPAGIFEKSTLATVRTWTFEPTLKGGGPVATEAHYNFKYRFEGVPEKENHYLHVGQWIKLDFTLLANGHTKDVVVIDKSSPDLPTRQAVQQIKGSIFAPNTQDGHPVDTPHQTVVIN